MRIALLQNNQERSVDVCDRAIFPAGFECLHVKAGLDLHLIKANNSSKRESHLLVRECLAWTVVRSYDAANGTT